MEIGSRSTEKIISIDTVFPFICRVVVVTTSSDNGQQLANQGSVSEALTRANIVPIWGVVGCTVLLQLSRIS